MTAVLAGVGVDAERIERFVKLAAGGPRWRHVFSQGEAEHLSSLPHPALAYSAAFCCKEAVLKALGERYSFPECECRFTPGSLEPAIALSAALLGRYGLAAAHARFHGAFPGERGECVLEVHLFRGPVNAPPGPDGPQGSVAPLRSRLETLAIADVEAERAHIEARDFTPAEIDGLGRRRVQSLAGSLSLKRALIALWGEAGFAPVAPREIEIAHRPSGAPCVAVAPPGLPAVLVSIAHTRSWAYGLAVLPPSGDCR
jgi:phosphopantetheinyl transferase (holo-ACP synthase)